MEKIEFRLKPDAEFIELNKLLKILGLAQTGGHAKIIIDEGLVIVNDNTELRKRKKLRKGDIVKYDNKNILID